MDFKIIYYALHTSKEITTARDGGPVYDRDGPSFGTSHREGVAWPMVIIQWIAHSKDPFPNLRTVDSLPAPLRPSPFVILLAVFLLLACYFF